MMLISNFVLNKSFILSLNSEFMKMPMHLAPKSNPSICRSICWTCINAETRFWQEHASTEEDTPLYVDGYIDGKWMKT